MNEYSIQFSGRFDRGLSAIENQTHIWGSVQTTQYISDILNRCETLTIFPHRFEKEIINGVEYRAFTHKAHKIFYQIFETTQTVDIIAVLHGHQLPGNQL